MKYLRNRSNNHHDVTIIPTEVRRKAHIHGKSWIVDIVLGLESDWILWILLEDHPRFRGWEGDDLTRGSHTRIQFRGDPALVPATDGINHLVLAPIWTFKSTVWTTGVCNSGIILNTSIPLPSATLWSLWRGISAVYS